MISLHIFAVYRLSRYSLLLGFIMSKNPKGLWFYVLIESSVCYSSRFFEEYFPSQSIILSDPVFSLQTLFPSAVRISKHYHGTLQFLPKCVFLEFFVKDSLWYKINQLCTTVRCHYIVITGNLWAKNCCIIIDSLSRGVKQKLVSIFHSWFHLIMAVYDQSPYV